MSYYESNSYKSTIDQLAFSENKLREQVIKKDKLIIELDKQVKNYEGILTKQKRILVEKDALIDDLKLEITDVNIKLKNSNDKLNNKNHEVNSILSSQAEKDLFEQNERKLLRAKLEELTTLNKKLLDKNKELSYLNEEKERETTSLKRSNNDITNQLKDYLKELEDKYQLQKENQSLLLEINQIKKSKELLTSQSAKAENDLNDIVLSLNKEIDMMREWIDTYLSSYFIKGSEIPNLPLTINNNMSSKINIEKLKLVLEDSRKKIHKEINDLNTKFCEEKQTNDSLIQHKHKSTQENNILKQTQLELTQEIYSWKEKVNTIREEHNSFVYKIEKALVHLLSLSNLQFNSHESSINNKCLQIIEVIITNYDTFSKEDERDHYINSLKALLQERDGEIEVLKKDKLNNNEQTLINKLEKKIVHLQRDIELKQIQIKSQEQMINRRSQEISELKVTSSNGYDQISITKKINTLEVEKEKLISDNVNLINKLNSLQVTGTKHNI